VHQERDVLCKFFNLYKKKNQKVVERWFHPKNLSRVCGCSTRLQFCSWRQAQTDNQIHHGEQRRADRACQFGTRARFTVAGVDGGYTITRVVAHT
jgi:hypothetical protein